jgi:hypothetical protein
MSLFKLLCCLLIICCVFAQNTPEKVFWVASGATFPQTIVRRWAERIAVKTNGYIGFNYTGGGSGRGVTDFLSGQLGEIYRSRSSPHCSSRFFVFAFSSSGKNNGGFSCSDAPMTSAQYKNATATFGTVMHIPWTCKLNNRRTRFDPQNGCSFGFSGRRRAVPYIANRRQRLHDDGGASGRHAT